MLFAMGALLLALVLVALQNTCKKKLNRGSKDVKYDIPMCQYHSTRPQPIQLVPIMQKKLFMSSFPTSNTQKMTENGPIWAKNGKKRTAEISEPPI